MNKGRASDATLTSGEVSRLTGIPLQTLIRWDRSGTLTAKRPGQRSSPRAARRYDESGLVTALFARHVSRMGFAGDHLAQMTRLMQKADRQMLRRWVLYSYRSLPGLFSHDFGELKDVRRHVDWLRERGALVDEPADLWTIRNGLLGMARGLIAQGGEILGLKALREDD